MGSEMGGIEVAHLDLNSLVAYIVFMLYSCLRTRGNKVYFLVQMQWKTDVSLKLLGRELVVPSFLHFFILCRPSLT